MYLGWLGGVSDGADSVKIISESARKDHTMELDGSGFGVYPRDHA